MKKHWQMMREPPKTSNAHAGLQGIARKCIARKSIAWKGIWALLLSLCFSSLLWAAETEPEPEADKPSMAPKATERATVNTEKSRLLQLAQSIDAKQVLWLNGRQGDVAAVMALYLPANKAAAEGAILMLHDIDQHPDWPGVVGSLRHSLPDAGWHTLSLALSYQDEREIPKRVLLTRTDAAFPFPDKGAKENATEQAEEGALPESDVEPTGEPELTDAELEATNEATEQLEEELIAEGATSSEEIDINAQDGGVSETKAPPPGIGNIERINLGLSQLQGFGLQNRVMLGVGQGAEEMVRFLIAYPDYAQSLQGFVWVDAEFDQNLLVELKEAAPGFLERKVLDVYDSTREDLDESLESRLDFARRNGMVAYRQDGLAGSTLLIGSGTQQLQNRIRSWLKKQAPGMRYTGQTRQ